MGCLEYNQMVTVDSSLSMSPYQASKHLVAVDIAIHPTEATPHRIYNIV